MDNKIKKNAEKIYVVISAFNEEKTIADIIIRVKKISDNIIITLAKKSVDSTKIIAESLGAKIIRDSGKGKGEGMRRACADIGEGIIVFIDADGSHIPEDTPGLIQPINEGRADMVIGSRFLGGSEELGGSIGNFLRKFFSLCINCIIELRFGSYITDTQNGFRAIRAPVLQELKLTSSHTEIETEMCMKCLKLNYRILEVPTLELKRKFGKSYINLTRDGWRYVWIITKNLF
jgi:dolichol-phosphate mannosyltransferase